MNYFSDAIEELRSVPISDNEGRVEDICRALEFETLEQGSWPAAFFPDVLNLLSDSRFLSVRTSWHLLKFLQENWKYLSPSDVSSFKSTLVAAFDKFGDFMGAFLAAEMLGEYYADGSTLSAFKTLSEVAKLPTRELVPLGFENLARATGDQTLRESAIQELRNLLEDESEAIRNEAALSLGRIERAT